MNRGYLSKKNFHPAKLSNQIKVWKAEQKQKEELQRVETLKQEKLEEIKITTNKNMLPNDTLSPKETSGLRIGFAAITTRGCTIDQAKEIARLIHGYLSNAITKEEALSKVDELVNIDINRGRLLNKDSMSVLQPEFEKFLQRIKEQTAKDTKVALGYFFRIVSITR